MRENKNRITAGFWLLICFLLSSFLVGCMSDKPEDTYDVVSLVEQQAEDIYEMWKKQSDTYEMNSYSLSQNYKLCRAAVGDLDGDGQDDMAIVLDCEPDQAETPEEDKVIPDNTRETFILLRNNEKFKVIARNRGLVMGEEEGGVFGDPFADIVIADGILTIYNYGGSSDRWGLDYSFIYYNNNLRLSKIESSSYSTLTAMGDIYRYDYLNGTYEQYSVNNMDEDLSDVLIDQGTFEAPESYIDSPVSVPTKNTLSERR